MDGVSDVGFFFTGSPHVTYVLLPRIFHGSVQQKRSHQLYQPLSPGRGAGVWGTEINRGTLAFIEDIRVSSEYRRQGVGHWAIENLLKSNVLAVCISSDSSL